ncbi:MAG: DUF748 domain-containing protein [Candidatus Accumulibacter sp.]|jgi:hypothetical protein|nr:DUF748 domain-containing protein [Accumulibacter sp.]
MNVKSRAWVLILVGIFLAVVAVFQATQHVIGARIESVIGPHGRFREFRIGLKGIEILDLRIEALPEGRSRAWPDSLAFHADRILIEPSIVDFFASRVRFQNLRIERASIVVLRTAEGSLKVLPGAFDNAGKDESSIPGESTEEKKTPLMIDSLEIVDGTIDFFDASILRPKAHRIRIEKINAALGKIRYPEYDGSTSINLSGVVKGARNDGKLTIFGSVEFATMESGVTARLRGIDLTLFQPYLLEKGVIRKGNLDIDLKSAIRQGKLNAPGEISIDDLELSNVASLRFIGIPSGIAAARLKNRLGKISFHFVLKGNIWDPKFSLGKSLSINIGSSMADYFGIGITGGNASGLWRNPSKRLLKDGIERSK